MGDATTVQGTCTTQVPAPSMSAPCLQMVRFSISISVWFYYQITLCSHHIYSTPDGFNTCPPPTSYYNISDYGPSNSSGQHLITDSLYKPGDNYTTCSQQRPNFLGGAASFDNIFLSFIAIFQVVRGFLAQIIT